MRMTSARPERRTSRRSLPTAELRNDRHLSVHDLKRRISEGEIDTVVVAFTDMQGRLQGKRMHAAYFVDHVLEHGTRAATTCSASTST